MSKPTIATVKSFIRKNRDNLLILCRSDFDPMTDCVQFDNNAQWHPAKLTEPERANKHNEGICGVWFVGRSRDYVNRIQEDGIEGFEVYNCCGSWSVGIKK